jgi:hypothetical protein
VSHRVLSPQQFNLAQVAGLHPSLGGENVPDVIHGRAATHVMTQAGIRQTPRTGGKVHEYFEHVDAPHIAGVAQGYGEKRGYPHGEVWTSQSHLHVPTIKRYMQGDIPKLDPDYDIDESEGPHVPYEPETYHYGGKQWIAEGHHRIVAKRLGR